jgi:hypothetical protein
MNHELENLCDKLNSEKIIFRDGLFLKLVIQVTEQIYLLRNERTRKNENFDARYIANYHGNKKN